MPTPRKEAASDRAIHYTLHTHPMAIEAAIRTVREPHRTTLAARLEANPIGRRIETGLDGLYMRVTGYRWASGGFGEREDLPTLSLAVQYEDASGGVVYVPKGHKIRKR